MMLFIYTDGGFSSSPAHNKQKINGSRQNSVSIICINTNPNTRTKTSLFQSFFQNETNEEDVEEGSKSTEKGDFAKRTIISTNNNSSSSSSSSNNLEISRGQAIFVLLGGSAYINLALTVFQKIQRGENIYPEDHERRASKTFNTAMTNFVVTSLDLSVDGDVEEVGGGEGQSTKKSDSTSSYESNTVLIHRPLRVLEVGIGSSCRTILRGAYDDALKNIAQLIHSTTRIDSSTSTMAAGIEFIGVDIDIPKDPNVVENCRKHLVSSIQQHQSFSSLELPIALDVQLGDVDKGLPFPDGYFDVITTSLVLCSVENQYQAVNEIKRMLNPNGGTFGFIEHVAVNLENENERKELAFLDWQQQILDPLQQKVAHNCHLHRNTEQVIARVFDNDGHWVQKERFQVKDMWPVSCQSSGVIQRVA